MLRTFLGKDISLEPRANSKRFYVFMFMNHPTVDHEIPNIDDRTVFIPLTFSPQARDQITLYQTFKEYIVFPGIKK